MKKVKVNSNATSRIWILGLGVGVSLISIMVMLIGSAICVSNEYLSLDLFNKLVPVLHYLSVLLGGIVTGLLVSDNKWNAITLYYVVITILQICFALIFFDGITWQLFINVIAGIAGALTAIVVVRQKKNGFKVNARKRKRR